MSDDLGAAGPAPAPADSSAQPSADPAAGSPAESLAGSAVPEPGFDELRAAVLPGGGVVARFPGIVCLASADTPDDDLRQLLHSCAEVSAAQPSAPGRALARRLAGWLTQIDAGPQFGTVAAIEDGLAVFLCGPISVTVPGRDLPLSGADAGAWLDRVLPPQQAPMLLATASTAAEADAVTDGALDLRAGTVPGGGVVLCPPAAPLAPAAPLPPAAPATPAGPLPAPHARPIPGPAPAEGAQPAGEPSPPRRSDAILGVPPDEPQRPPLPVVGQPARVRISDDPTVPPTSAESGLPTPAAAVAQAAPAGPKACGYECARGHLNDPRNHFCVICGIRMAERTAVLVEGLRPPLGLLVFDDGAIYTVDGDYLVGRDPESDPRVANGTLRSLMVTDDAASVSRAHLEIRLFGWDVTCVDSGSRNGTFVALPGEPSWSPLPAKQPLRLVPGTRVRIGNRGFVFESPSGVR